MMVIYLPVKFEFDWTKRFRVKSLETEMLTDRQRDVGHINLIGGLVTCNPPKTMLMIIQTSNELNTVLLIGITLRQSLHKALGLVSFTEKS